MSAKPPKPPIQTARLIPIKGVPADVEVLYPNWHHNPGTDPKRLSEPYPYTVGKTKTTPPHMGIRSDFIWGWVIHPHLRMESDSKCRKHAFRMLTARYGSRYCWLFRPRDWGGPGANAITPIRIWTGRKWTWFWAIPNTVPSSRLP